MGLESQLNLPNNIILRGGREGAGGTYISFYGAGAAASMMGKGVCMSEREKQKEHVPFLTERERFTCFLAHKTRISRRKAECRAGGGGTNGKRKFRQIRSREQRLFRFSR